MTDSRDTTSHNSTEDSGFDPKTGQGYIDLEDYEVTDQSAPGGFTVAQKKFLVNSINKLLKLSYGEFFRQPANYLDPKLKKIDLRTMRSKLRDSLYLSVEDIKADFDIMVHGSEVGNGTYHQLTEQARRLRTAFEAYMSDFPGKSEESASKKKANERYVDDFPGKGKESAQRKRANEMNTSDFSGKDEDFIPRRKARMREPEATLAQNASSSPPRAAKTAMLGRKYPRDHW